MNTSTTPPPIVWITWEKQRRSLLLAGRLNARLYLIDFTHKPFLRRALSALVTAYVLVKQRKALICVQNPSMALALQACIFKKLLGFPLAVDRHSNFMLGSRSVKSARYRWFMTISRFTLRIADLTIVTNRQIADRVRSARGNPFILPDPFMHPHKIAASAATSKPFTILFPSSWARDEPVVETAQACRELGSGYRVYITGKPRESILERIGTPPPNFIMTGYVSDERYLSLMSRCHAVMPLTRFPELLVCGGYEGMSLGKPLLLGDSAALREFYPRGALFTDCTPADIVNTIRLLRTRRRELQRQIRALYKLRHAQWHDRFARLTAVMQSLHTGDRP
jgi:glycosyltransferase involved in cell wall biosynthesis